jgi:hypothetical protein
VLKYDGERNTIEVEMDKNKSMDGMKLEVLIFNKSSAYHYQGTIHYFSGTKNTEIAIYRGEQKKDRKNERFAINLKGVITENLQVKRTHISTPNLPIMVLDISANGIRVERKEEGLEIGDFIRIQVFVSGEAKVFYGKVVRSIHIEGEGKQYGCLLVKQEEYERIRRIVHGAELMK